MIYERTLSRTFSVECDYCGRLLLVEIQGVEVLSGTKAAYEKAAADGWDVSGPFDRCDRCTLARNETLAITAPRATRKRAGK